MSELCKLYKNIVKFLEEKAWHVVALFTRLYLAYVFVLAGWLKFGYILNDNTDTLFFLFEEYNIPFLPVELAAYLGTFGELIFGGLIAIGLLARPAALGLIALSGVIYLADSNPDVPMWVLLSGVILTKGAGYLSVDNFLEKAFCKK